MRAHQKRLNKHESEKAEIMLEVDDLEQGECLACTKVEIAKMLI